MPDAIGSTATIGDAATLGGAAPARGKRVEPVSAAVDPAPRKTSSAAPTPTDRPAAWRRAGLLFALGLAVLVSAYIGTVLGLIEGWSTGGTFAHGYLIFPTSAWLVWRLRDRLAGLMPKAQPLALVPIVGCGLLWLAGHAASVRAPEQYAFVAMIPCLVWGIFGNDVTRRILYPLAFLVFAVPAGDFLMPTLMDHTADFTVAALRLSGVPVFREGNFFTIPSGSWSVVEACSGLRYLIASVTLGCLFAYLNYRGAWRRAAFIVASIAVPILANWLRAYMIVMIAHLSSNKLATGVDHLVYGWLFFGVVMLALFWVGSFWRDDDEPGDDPGDEPGAADPAPTTDRPLPVATRGSTNRGLGLVTAAMLATALPWPAVGGWLERIADGPRPSGIPVGAIPGWQADETPFSTFVPHYMRPRASSNAVFVAGDRKVALFVAYYRGQSTNGPLVTYGNDVVIVEDKTWGAVAQRGRTVDVGGKPLGVVEYEIKGATARGDERLLAWRWYWINGRLTTSNVMAKAWTALDKLTGRGDDSAVIVVTTPVTGEADTGAPAALAAFVAAAEPRITAQLASIRDGAR